MRLLFVVHMFLPENRAGVETYTWQVARALAGRGHAVRVLTARKIISLTTGETRNRSLEDLEVVEVVNNLDFASWEDSWACPAMEESFRAQLADFRPDVVHVQHLMHWSVRLPEIAREAGVRCLATLHDYWSVCGRMGPLVDADGAMCPGPSAERCPPCLARTDWGQSAEAVRWIARLGKIRRATGLALDRPLRAAQGLRERLAGGGGDDARPAAGAAPSLPEDERRRWEDRFHRRRQAFARALSAFDRVVSPSGTLAAFVEEQGMPAGTIERLPQGIDHAPFAGAAPRPRPAGAPLRLGYAATLAPHKGLHVLLEAVARIDPDLVTLRIHGPWRQHRAYREDLVARHGARPNVRFGESLDRAGLRAFFADLDYLCLPSLWNECCPLSIQEAAVAGVPAIVSDLGGMAELVRSDVNGLTLPPGDAAAWAAALEDLARRRERVEAHRAAVVPPPTLARHLDALEALYADSD